MPSYLKLPTFLVTTALQRKLSCPPQPVRAKEDGGFLPAYFVNCLLSLSLSFAVSRFEIVRLTGKIADEQRRTGRHVANDSRLAIDFYLFSFVAHFRLFPCAGYTTPKKDTYILPYFGIAE